MADNLNYFKTLCCPLNPLGCYHLIPLCTSILEKAPISINQKTFYYTQKS